MERAVAQLQKCYGKIEERIVGIFDEARRRGDLDSMAACTRIMSHFQRNNMLAEVRGCTQQPVGEQGEGLHGCVLASGCTPPKQPVQGMHVLRRD